VSVFNDIQATIEKAPLGEQAKLYQVVADAYALYYGVYSSEASRPSGTPDIFQKIRDDDVRKGPGMISGFVKEFSRMAKQQEKQGAGPSHGIRSPNCRIKSFPRPQHICCRTPRASPRQ